MHNLDVVLDYKQAEKEIPFDKMKDFINIISQIDLDLDLLPE